MQAVEGAVERELRLVAGEVFGDVARLHVEKGRLVLWAVLVKLDPLLAQPHLHPLGHPREGAALEIVERHQRELSRAGVDLEQVRARHVPVQAARATGVDPEHRGQLGHRRGVQMQRALAVEVAGRRAFARLPHALGLSGRVKQRQRFGPGVLVAPEKHADVRPELVGKGAVRPAAFEGEQGEVHPQVIAARVRRRPEGGVAMEPAQEPERPGEAAEPFGDGCRVSNLLPAGLAAQGEPRIGQAVENRTMRFVEGPLALAAGGLRYEAYQALEAPAVALALFEKTLLLELVLEDEEHTRVDRDGMLAEHLRDIVPEFVLREVLLEGSLRAEHAVLEPRPGVLSDAASIAATLRTQRQSANAPVKARALSARSSMTLMTKPRAKQKDRYAVSIHQLSSK